MCETVTFPIFPLDESGWNIPFPINNIQLNIDKFLVLFIYFYSI